MLLLLTGAWGCESASYEDNPNRRSDVWGDTASDTAGDESPDSEVGTTDEGEIDTAEMVPRSAAFAPTTVTKLVPFPNPYEEGTNGFVYIQNRSMNDEYIDSNVDGQFFAVLSDPTWEEYVEFVVEADGIDECSLGIFTGLGIGTTDETIDWLNAGDLSLTTEDAEYPLEWAYINEAAQSVRYYLYGFPEKINGLLNGTVGVTATGDETPSMTQGVIEGMMPEVLTLLQPEQNDIVMQGPLSVEWSAGDSSDTISLIMTVFKKTNEDAGGYQMDDVHEIRCSVADDGGFEIPAFIMDQLPADYSAHFNLTREKIDYLDVTSAFKVRLILSQYVQVEMEVPSTLIP